MRLVYFVLVLRGNFRALTRVDRLWLTTQGSFVTPCSSETRRLGPVKRVMILFTSADNGSICIERGRTNIDLGHRGTLRLLLIDQGEWWLNNIGPPLAAASRSSSVVSTVVAATVLVHLILLGFLVGCLLVLGPSWYFLSHWEAQWLLFAHLARHGVVLGRWLSFDKW